MPELLAYAGIGLMILGAIVALFSFGGVVPGGKKAGAAVALVLIVAGLAAGGFGGLFAPLAAAPGEPGVDGPLYRVAIEDIAGDTNDVLNAENIEPGEHVINMLDVIAGDAANLDWDSYDDATWILELDIGRIDAGQTTDTETAFIDVGTVDSIRDVVGGTTRPLLAVAGADNHWDVTWSDPAAANEPALDSGSRWTISLSPGDAQELDAAIAFNWPAFTDGGGVLVGSTYSFTLVVMGVVLTLNCVMTGA